MMLSCTKRDLFSVAGLALSGIFFNFRDPLPELKDWPDRVPEKFRSVRFKLLDGRELSILQPEAYEALKKADEIVLLSIPGSIDESYDWRMSFETWWRDLT